MNRQAKRGALLASLALALAASACHRSHHRHGGGAKSTFSFVEVEPNDFASSANYLGTIAVGERIFVDGYIDDSGFDPFDGFALTTHEPMDVEFYLTAADPYADLDVCYFDPYTGVEQACWETSSNPEAGLLALGGGRDFHLVVASYVGGSPYTLELVGRPPGYAPSAAEPGSRAESERERAVPFSAYGAGAEVQARAEEPPAPAARGRLILLDPDDGSVVTRHFEVEADGVRAPAGRG